MTGTYPERDLMTNATQSDALAKFFVAANREFDRMVERSARAQHPWDAHDIAAGKIYVTALVYGPQWELCSIDILSDRRKVLTQESVATAYLVTPEAHVNLPGPFTGDDGFVYAPLDELEWWDETLAKQEPYAARIKERQTSGAKRGGQSKRRSPKRGPRRPAVAPAAKESATAPSMPAAQVDLSIAMLKQHLSSQPTTLVTGGSSNS